jgi:hypothetical protein
MKIDKCICYDRSFRRIYKESSENGIDNLEDLQKIMNICNKCKLCNPYIDEMYKSGKLEFDYIIK